MTCKKGTLTKSVLPLMEQETLWRKKKEIPVYTSISLFYPNWRGHQTFPTVVSLKGRLPQILQSKSALSCEIVPIHSLFRHSFIKKPKSEFNRKYTYIFCSYVADFEKQILVLIGLQMLFEGRYKTQDYFQYFFHLFSVPSFIFSKNGG